MNFNFLSELLPIRLDLHIGAALAIPLVKMILFQIEHIFFVLAVEEALHHVKIALFISEVL